MTANDRQEGGDHYKNMSVQPWDALASWMTPEQFEGYLMGSALAYLARVNTKGVPGKGGDADVAKAVHYLEKWREVREGRRPTRAMGEVIDRPNIKAENWTIASAPNWTSAGASVA